MRRHTEPLRLVLLGAPGAGKGTICQRLIKEYPSFTHLSSGTLLRNHASQQTHRHTHHHGKQEKRSLHPAAALAPILSSGQLAPDAIVETIVKDNLLHVRHQNWCLDGFPRTVTQAKTLDSWHAMLGDVQHVVQLHVPDEVVLERIQHRMIHLQSGRTYHTLYNPPKRTGLDDLTGEPLIRRPDDDPTVVQARLQKYRHEVSPLLRYYGKRVVTFEGIASDDIWSNLSVWLQSQSGSLAHPPHRIEAVQ